jgi:predicted RecB family nuclease
MQPKITSETLEAYCYCPQKFHLKLRGEQGIKTEYELMRAELRASTRARAIKNHGATSASGKSFRLTPTRLTKASQYLFDGIYEDDDFNITIDGVAKATASRDPCSPSYRPILFSGSLKIEPQHRLLLRVYAYALSHISTNQVNVGLLWNTRDVAARIPLRINDNDFTSWLQELLSATRTTSPPPLLLNKHCQICEFQQRCREQAIGEGNLSLLKGMTAKEIARYNAKGLFTITQLSYTFRSRRRPKRVRAAPAPHYFSLQAQAIREQKIFIHGAVNFNVGQPRMYFDIEGTPDTRSNYLIGALFVEHGKEEFASFWAEHDDDSRQIVSEFLRHVGALPRHHLVHFGSYETSALRQAKHLVPYDLGPVLEEAISRSTNLLSAIRTRVYFPTYSNSLKEIGGFLGARWSESSPSGIQTLAWREKWLQSGDPRWRDRLLQYNKEDCRALRRVAEFIDELVARQDIPRQVGDQRFVFTDTLPKGERRGHIFRKPDFAISEFERINQCAYFDYQRDRVAARSCRRRNRTNHKHTKKPRWKLRLSKIARILVKNCPQCRSRKVKPGRSIARTVTDLKFTTRGVKRWVVRYVANEYTCEKCHITFIPTGVPPAGSKFGWGLSSWCLYNYIVAGQNLSRVTAGLGHLFQLTVPQPTVHRFKEYVADHYRQYSRGLFSELIKSPHLHLDETPVKLQSRTGYVWVLTNGDIAYYFYRPSREGSFLRELLTDFSGVLISDFFTAYDSLEVRQQRCLIHLLRDLNEELLKAPYDEELRMLGDQFAAVLGPIVKTIDDHGLKRWHLSKHKTAAAKFARWVADAGFKSIPASKLRARITKYENMLFTFLDYNGVAWNNNNAERAMKVFARHRRFADGRFTARSIEHYLILLTVYQTCEFRGLDFLDFILGRKSVGEGPAVPWVLNATVLRGAAEPLPGFDGHDDAESLPSPA